MLSSHFAWFSRRQALKNNYAIFGTLFNLSWIRNIYKHYNGQFLKVLYNTELKRHFSFLSKRMSINREIHRADVHKKRDKCVCTGNYDRNFVTVLYQFCASKH